VALSRFQKIAATGAAAAAIGGTAFSASAFASAPGSAGSTGAAARPAAVAAGHPAAVARTVKAAAHAAADVPVRRVVGHGRVDGQAWSVTLEYYRSLPAGFPAAAKALPGAVKGAPATTPATGLLCQRMVIGGVLIDHQGGPWADCRPVEGAHDPGAAGSEGLWGSQDKGTSGTRLMVGDTDATVAYGVLTFSDGSRATGHAVTVPHTSYRAWAVAIPDGKTIATVDTYDANHHLLSSEDYWR
jgi:hypothetical protein